jgi:hypothetical protein
MGADKRG